ncbi:MAG: hypothetical protein ACRC5H_00035 [Treponemataceae bacterium]
MNSFDEKCWQIKESLKANTEKIVVIDNDVFEEYKKNDFWSKFFYNFFIIFLKTYKKIQNTMEKDELLYLLGLILNRHHSERERLKLNFSI